MRKNHYTPKKKKVHPPSLSEVMKLVRVNARTEIMVSVSLSNEEAIERFYARHKTVIRPPEVTQYPIPIEECYGSLEELAATVDDGELPDEE